MAGAGAGRLDYGPLGVAALLQGRIFHANDGPVTLILDTDQWL